MGSRLNGKPAHQPRAPTKDGDTEVDHGSLDLTGAQAARQLEAGETSLEGDADPLDGASNLFCFLPPVRQREESILVG
jgi:hypothetical protein